MDEIDARVREIAIEVCQLPTIEPIHWTAAGTLADYGFDSLTLVQLVVRVEQEFDLDLEPEHITAEWFSSLGSVGALVRFRKQEAGR